MNKSVLFNNKEVKVQHNIKKIVFNKSHIGTNVTCMVNGKGIIFRFADDHKTPLGVEFYESTPGESNIKYYSKYGCSSGNIRSLFIGHNVKLNISEDELLSICPVCGETHKPTKISGHDKFVFMFSCGSKRCTIIDAIKDAEFELKSEATDAIDKLIALVRG